MDWVLNQGFPCLVPGLVYIYLSTVRCKDRISIKVPPLSDAFSITGNVISTILRQATDYSSLFSSFAKLYLVLL